MSHTDIYTDTDTHRHIQMNTNTHMYTLRYTNTAHYCIRDKLLKLTNPICFAFGVQCLD